MNIITNVFSFCTFLNNRPDDWMFGFRWKFLLILNWFRLLWSFFFFFCIFLLVFGWREETNEVVIAATMLYFRTWDYCFENVLTFDCTWHPWTWSHSTLCHENREAFDCVFVKMKTFFFFLNYRAICEVQLEFSFWHETRLGRSH